MQTAGISGDLHVHTTASDGTVSVDERIREAQEKSLDAVAITDHDVVASELTARREIFGELEFITGVELRADIFDTKIEILGYYVDPADENLQSLLQQAREFRRVRNDAMLQELNTATELDLSRDTITSDTGSLGRPQMAAALVDEGTVPSIQAAFDEYLADGAACFVPMERIDSETVIETIQRSGGVASLAHPGRISASKQTVHRMLSKLSDQGLDAIEVWYPYADGQQRYADIGQTDAAELADEYDLLRTGGSDCHGPGSGKFRLGDTGVSEQGLTEIRTRAATRCPFTT